MDDYVWLVTTPDGYWITTCATFIEAEKYVAEQSAKLKLIRLDFYKSTEGA